MILLDLQLAAIQQATKILEDAGLSLSSPSHSLVANPDYRKLVNTIDNAQLCAPSPSVQGSLYEPPAARRFTSDDLRRRIAGSVLTRQTSVAALVDHPLGAIVEYPETGTVLDERIAHRFTVDPAKFSHPKSNFQYSLGDDHGGCKNVQCGLLTDDSDTPVLCSHIHTSCECLVIFLFFVCSHFPRLGKGLKICSSCPHPGGQGHCFTSRSTLPVPACALAHASSAEEEVFMKTLAFFCVLKDKGCAFESDDQASGNFDGLENADEDEATDDDEAGDDDEGEDRVFGAETQHLSRDLNCRGRIFLKGNQFGCSYVQ